ncbi:hypothetical protein N7486_009251 [Penicillium sp. IBT 16267x]|nr:hypothetical protein N7486_009251 [Penicillium sp. IBT 16267x]
MATRRSESDSVREVPLAQSRPDLPRGSSQGGYEVHSGVPSNERHQVARSYDFEVPGGEIDLMSEAMDLPRPLSCDFPPGDEDEVETER